jgi:hypothetical protein
MPAGLPGSTASQNAANPSAGRAVIFDALSGPKGSPFDKDASGNASTGALSTGIGFGSPPIIYPTSLFASSSAAGNFTDDYSPGISAPDLDVTNSTIMYIGGGRCNAAANDGIAAANPYTAGAGICMAGNGGSRDGGASSPFTGFQIKTVTATGTVANGAVVETGLVNRSGVTITAGQSVFGSSTTALPAPV